MAKTTLALLLLLSGCSGNEPGGDATLTSATSGVDGFDLPVRGLSTEWLTAFNDGDFRFSLPLRDGDGLGPLYTRAACASCHESALRGPGSVQKMSVVEADGVTPASDQSPLAFGHTVHPLAAGGGTTPILPPAAASNIKLTVRVGPPLLGRGYLEAVDDAEIERGAARQAARDDEIHGRANHVIYGSEPNRDTRFHRHQEGDVLLGRFGLKARIGALDDFTADAFQGDMGITSPLRPSELPNPEQLSDDDKPGVDVDEDSVNLRAMYVRLLAIPSRREDETGLSAFEAARCSVCHTPSLHTRADYPIRELADIEAPVYTDLLLHRMGANLADGLPEAPSVDGEAGSFDWRTAPLIGLRFQRSYLHDGRAKSLAEAIAQHGGEGSEANDSLRRFDALSTDARRALLRFVGEL